MAATLDCTHCWTTASWTCWSTCCFQVLETSRISSVLREVQFLCRLSGQNVEPEVLETADSRPARESFFSQARDLAMKNMREDQWASILQHTAPKSKSKILRSKKRYLNDMPFFQHFLSESASLQALGCMLFVKHPNTENSSMFIVVLAAPRPLSVKRRSR